MDSTSDKLHVLRQKKLKLIGNRTAALQRVIPLKRTRTLSETSASRSIVSEFSPEAFRARIVHRDTDGCVLTEKDEWECDACHIVPFTYFRKHDLVGEKIWDSAFPYGCDNPEHRVMDVRNGILMWAPLNEPFDKFEFTILKIEGEYFVKTLDEDEFEEAANQDHKKLQQQILTSNPDKINEWPGEKFLQFHNECFVRVRFKFNSERTAIGNNSFPS